MSQVLWASGPAISWASTADVLWRGGGGSARGAAPLRAFHPGDPLVSTEVSAALSAFESDGVVRQHRSDSPLRALQAGAPTR